MNIDIYILIEIKFCALDISGDRICNHGNLYRFTYIKNQRYSVKTSTLGTMEVSKIFIWLLIRCTIFKKENYLYDMSFTVNMNKTLAVIDKSIN